MTSGDYLFGVATQAYSGTQYLTTAIAGFQITPGATITSSLVPTDFYVDLNAAGINTDPKASSTYTIPFRIIAGVGSSSYPNDHYGTVLVNAPSTFTEAQTVSYGSVVHETASLNTFANDQTEWHSFSLLHWRPNAVGTFHDVGGLGWAYNLAGGNADGNESTFFETTGLWAGASTSLFSVYAVNGSGGFNGHGLMRVSYAYSFYTTGSNVIKQQTGAGSDYDLVIQENGSATSAVFGEDALGGHFFRINAGGTGPGCLWVGPSSNGNGWCYDQNVGGLYSQNDFGSTQIGRPGYLATTSTKEFLGLPTMKGLPTGVPGFMSAGKSSAVYDETDHKVCVYDLGTTAWRCVVVN